MTVDFLFTDFDYMAIDGTIVKAYNNNFNIIRKLDVMCLIKILKKIIIMRIIIKK